MYKYIEPIIEILLIIGYLIGQLGGHFISVLLFLSPLFPLLALLPITLYKMSNRHKEQKRFKRTLTVLQVGCFLYALMWLLLAVI